MSNKLEEKLENIFNNINSWLKFAEQKNAALLVFNLGLVWGVSRILINSEVSNGYFLLFNISGYLFIISSIIVCLSSFSPIIKDQWFKRINKNKYTEDNSIFFADIAKYTDHEYLRLLSKKAGIKKKYTALEKDFANQIINNSKITLEKYRYFNFSYVLTIIGVVLFSISMIIKVFSTVV